MEKEVETWDSALLAGAIHDAPVLHDSDNHIISGIFLS